MRGCDITLLHVGLKETMSKAKGQFTYDDLKGLMLAVWEEGFEVQRALGFIGKNKRTKHFAEDLAEDADVARWMRGSALRGMPKGIDFGLAKRNAVTHSDCWRTSGREETLDSQGLHL